MTQLEELRFVTVGVGKSVYVKSPSVVLVMLQVSCDGRTAATHTNAATKKRNLVLKVSKLVTNLKYL